MAILAIGTMDSFLEKVLVKLSNLGEEIFSINSPSDLLIHSIDDCDEHSSSKLGVISAYRAIITKNFDFSLNSCSFKFSYDARERFFAEWFAAIASITYAHPLVINRPSRGFWCGSSPTVFEQLDSIHEARKKQIITSHVTYPEKTMNLIKFMWAAQLSTSKKGWPFAFNPSVYFDGDHSISLLKIRYFKGRLFSTINENSPIWKEISMLSNFLSDYFKLDLLEIGMYENQGDLSFAYLSSWPTSDSLVSTEECVDYICNYLISYPGGRGDFLDRP